MSSPYDRYDRGSSRSKRGVWSHWVPLAITVTVATVGLAAWAWSQRKDDDYEHEEEHVPDLDYDNADYGDNPPYGSSRDYKPPPPPPESGVGTESIGVGAPGEIPGQSEPTWQARMSGALRRTPSPQQFLDSTGKTVVAGVAAAGAAMGKALASIREEDKAYDGGNVWSEEADAKRNGAGSSSSKRRKTVAIVVSADSEFSQMEDDAFHEHASILSHIPRNTDFAKVKLFILIFAPAMKDNGTDAATSNLPPPSLSSSFSNIGHDQAQTPGEEKSPSMAASNPAFNAVYSQALQLVEKENMILPFTTPNGHAHILRHLKPKIIYLQESLAGDNGSIVANMQTWLPYDITLVVGAESGSGGLADSESEAERTSKAEKWWQRPERVGRGRGVVVVDGMRVHDDWARRVQGQE